MRRREARAESIRAVLPLSLAGIGGPFATRDYTYNSLDLPTNMVSAIGGVGNVTDASGAPSTLVPLNSPTT